MTMNNMGDNWQDITITEITDPGNFLAKECPGMNMSKECRQFNRMQDQMNQFFSNEQAVTTIPPQPSVGNVYAGKRQSDRQWYRVEVERIMQTSRGPQASCYFVDHGESELIPVSFLRQLPDHFCEVPRQIQKFSLWAIEPVTLTTTIEDGDIMATKQRCRKWDISAVDFLKRLVKDSSSTKVDIQHQDQERNTVYVKLYLNTPDGQICVNDQLVKLEYAAKTVPQVHQPALNASEEIVKPRRQKKKMTQEDYLRMIEDDRFNHQNTDSDSSHKAHSDPQVRHKVYRKTTYDGSGDCESDSPVRHRGARSDMFMSDIEHHHNTRSGGSLLQVSQSDTELPRGLLNSRPHSGGRGKWLEGGDGGRGNISLNKLMIDNATGGSDRLDVELTGTSGDANSSSCFGKNVKGAESKHCYEDALSDPGQPKKIMLGRGFSFLSTSSDSDSLAKRTYDTKISYFSQNKTFSASMRVGMPVLETQSGDSDTNSLASSMGLKPVRSSPGGAIPDSTSQSDRKSTEASRDENFCEIFVPSRLPKCAMVSSQSCSSKSESPELKLGSILKKSPSPSTSSLEVNTVRFSESGTQEWLRKKGKEEGRKLLLSLSAGVGMRDHHIPTIPQMSRPDRLEHTPFLGVVYHGVSQPSPILDFTNLPFTERVKQAFLKKKFTSPMTIQAYCWPAVRRGRHVIGISPPGTGKTLAYLLLLLTQLSESKPYMPVPVGNGPYALILVPSWKKAQNVFDACTDHLQGQKMPRVISIFAGGCEDSKVVPLINGCEVLVATPPCLQRMMEKKYTNLSRLCHLVLDDAEILTEVFKSEVKYIMKTYADVVRESTLKRDVPRQRMVFASQWTKGIGSFIAAYIHQPLLVITSKMEAAVYGRVKQIVHMCKYENRSYQLRSILEGIGTPGNKIILCSSVVEEVEMLYGMLTAQSMHTLVCHDDMSLLDRDDMYRQWHNLNSRDAALIMVMTDECVTDSNITDATHVIHYNLPKSKTRFGNRMACMLNFFYDFSKPQESSVTPTSYIFVTDRNKMEVKSLASFLERSNSEIPKAMSSYMAGMQMGENEDEDKDLCRHIKAFGFCVNINKCQYRHRILPVSDCPRGRGFKDLPRTGEVKVRMNHILDANHYYVRLLEHRGEQKTDLNGIYISLLFDIASYFANKSNCRSQSMAKKGELCAIRSNEQDFHRVEILAIMESEGLQTPTAKVWYVDDGKTEIVDLCKLLTLPGHLKEVPYQAVEVYLCRVKPMDKDSEWTPRANMFIFEQLDEITELEACVVLSFGNTLWLDPLVQRVTMETIKMTTNHMRVRDELLKNGLGSNNPKHIEQLYQLCRECQVEVPRELQAKYLSGYEKTIDTESLPEDQEYHDIYVSAVVSPDLIYVQRKEHVKPFEEMLDEINDKMAKVEMEFDKDLSLCPGTYCLAQFTQDDRWYRGQVIEKLSDDLYNVFFCDFGDNDSLSPSRLCPLPDKYAGLPCQAIACKLAYVEPRGDNWDNNSGDALWDMTHFLTGEKKLLVAKILSKSDETSSGSYKYTIDLHDTNFTVDVHLPQELVWKRYASSPSLKDLMPKPLSASRKIYDSPVHKLKDLCAAIYWGENEDVVIKKSKEVSTIVTSQNKTSAVEAMVSCGGAAAVCRLIGYLHCLEAHQHIVESLTLAILFSPRICEVTIAENVPQMLVRCLEQSNFPALHQQAAKAISRLVTDSSYKVALERADATTTLCDLLDVTDNSQIQGLSLHALACLLKESQSVSQAVMETPVCRKVPDLLNGENTHDVIEAALTFLASLAHWQNAHSELKRDVLVDAVIQRLEDTRCCKCIHQVALLCHHLAQASRKNKTLLLEHRLVIVLQGVLQRDLEDHTTRKLCQELEASIAVRLPKQQQTLNHSRLLYDEEQDTNYVAVSWYQNTFRVVLTVRLKGISRDDFTISHQHVTFRSAKHNKSFDYELFEEILPQKTDIAVHENQTSVSLKKQNKGKWSRLLRQKPKPIGLTVDFEKFVNSDSEVSDEDVPFLLSRRRERKLPDCSKGQHRKHRKPLVMDDLETSSENTSDLASYSDDEKKDDATYDFR
ncbi:putative ATP-dependent RNA helicase TDRD12 [Haliotis cracherodii]|uniref:putative ATP-dependent RNA helicase TDRD12 n=1 Tax=Haliotis cracherodii TaxID=6455 RepID=UPI0039EA98D9